MFRLVDYGVYSIYVREPFTSSPNAYIDFATLDRETDSIPCEQGVHFGLRFILQTDWLVKIPLTVEWIPPDTVDAPGGGSKLRTYHYHYKETTNDTAYAFYGLDELYELRPGKWTCRIIGKNKLLIEKIFWLYRP